MSDRAAPRLRPGARSLDQVRLTSLSDLRPADLEAWAELAESAVEPNPFWSPDFVLSAARGLGSWGKVAILHVRDGPTWTACLPVHRHLGWHRVPLPCITSWLHMYCFLGTPLLADSGQATDLEALMRHLVRRVQSVTFAGLGRVAADGPVATALARSSSSPSIEFDRFPRATLRRRAQPDYLSGRIKGKHRREFRRLAQGLEAELGGELELVDRAEEPGAIEAFLSLEASGWKGREGTALASRPEHATFFREMGRAFAARQRFELLFLEAGERKVAARCNLLAGGVSFCFKVAYDEELKRFSPGRELELRQIERFHSNPQQAWMDSCADPDNEMFNRLWPDRRELMTIAYPAPGLTGVAAQPMLRSVAALRKRRRPSDAAGGA